MLQEAVESSAACSRCGSEATVEMRKLMEEGNKTTETIRPMRERTVCSLYYQTLFVRKEVSCGLLPANKATVKLVYKRVQVQGLPHVINQYNRDRYK